MALDKNKTSESTGKEVHELLVSKGVETPMQLFNRTDEDRLKGIENCFQEIMTILGLNLEDDSLSETPRRVAKMYLNEIFWGLDYKNFPKITTIENKMQYDNMLLERDIKVSSFCEHHFVNIFGVAHIAYIPRDRVIGLSKINRIVEFFSRRPQVQERLTEQIFHTLVHILGTDNVAVLVKAEHFCVKSRGIEDINSDTITSRLGGLFLDGDSLRNEFYQALRV